MARHEGPPADISTVMRRLLKEPTLRSELLRLAAEQGVRPVHSRRWVERAVLKGKVTVLTSGRKPVYVLAKARNVVAIGGVTLRLPSWLAPPAPPPCISSKVYRLTDDSEVPQLQEEKTIKCKPNTTRPATGKTTTRRPGSSST